MDIIEGTSGAEMSGGHLIIKLFDLIIGLNRYMTKSDEFIRLSWSLI